MGIAASAKRLWAHVQQGHPGRRFQDHYERSVHSRQKSTLLIRILKIIGGVVLILIGLVEIFIPGPAFLFLIVGGALLATESLVVARAMDWLELKVRDAWHSVRAWWRRRRRES